MGRVIDFLFLSFFLFFELGKRVGFLLVVCGEVGGEEGRVCLDVFLCIDNRSVGR